MIYTTLNRIREHNPCASGWAKLLKSLNKTKADDEPLPLAAVLESNSLDDAFWCLQAEPQHDNLWRLLAVKYARRVQHLLTDQRSLNALDVAERHAHGQATDEELASARAAAEAAGHAAWESAEASEAARYTAWAVCAAARAAAGAAARHAALAAAWESASDAAREQQADDLIELLTAHEAAPGENAQTAGGTV